MFLWVKIFIYIYKKELIEGLKMFFYLPQEFVSFMLFLDCY